MFRKKQPKAVLETYNLHFDPIPEVSEDQLDGLCGLGALNHALGNRDFGAYVVREASQTAIDSITAQLFGRYVIAQAEFGKGKPLHTDGGSVTFPTRITIHETIAGSGEAIILQWPSYPEVRDATYGNVEPDAASVDRVLFTDGLLRTFPGMLPEQAYKTTLGTGDVLVFDHTLPHSFMALTGDRTAQATYVA